MSEYQIQNGDPECVRGRRLGGYLGRLFPLPLQILRPRNQSKSPQKGWALCDPRRIFPAAPAMHGAEGRELFPRRDARPGKKQECSNTTCACAGEGAVRPSVLGVGSLSPVLEGVLTGEGSALVSSSIVK